MECVGFFYAPPSKVVKSYLHTIMAVFVSKIDAFGGRTKYSIECLVERA